MSSLTKKPNSEGASRKGFKFSAQANIVKTKGGLTIESIFILFLIAFSKRCAKPLFLNLSL